MDGKRKSTTKKKPKKSIKKKNTKSRKNKKTNIKSLLAFGILLVLLIVLIGITFSYAFWTSSETQIKQNEVAAGCLSFSFNDKDVNGNATNISLLNAYPISDEKGLNLNPYVFTITNTCTIEANFFIYLHNLATSGIDSKYIKVNVSDSNSTTLLKPTIVSNVNDGTLTNDVNSVVEEKIGSIKETYLLSNFSLQPEESATLNVRLWIDYDAPNSIMGLTYNSAISAFATTPN